MDRATGALIFTRRLPDIMAFNAAINACKKAGRVLSGILTSVVTPTGNEHRCKHALNLPYPAAQHRQEDRWCEATQLASLMKASRKADDTYPTTRILLLTLP